MWARGGWEALLRPAYSCPQSIRREGDPRQVRGMGMLSQTWREYWYQMHPRLRTWRVACPPALSFRLDAAWVQASGWDPQQQEISFVLNSG